MDDVGDIVRSIQIATTLNERVAQLVKARTYEHNDALSFHLGELRQLYPEVWTNLDHARAELARRGIDVPKYDELRSSYAASAGGVLDVNLHPAASEKAATVNAEGHQKAVEACYVLRAAVPGMSWVDWDNLARKEAEDLAAIGSLGPPRWQGMVGTALVVLFLIALVAGAVLLLTHLTH